MIKVPEKQLLSEFFDAAFRTSNGHVLLHSLAIKIS
jgi:hypothetical protein